MAPGLITKDTLHFTTEIGLCSIELCVGDITCLPKEEKVDVLVVSAFPGDYSPTPSSLIGQLKIKLGLSVRELSKDKEEDLRRQYYCWWSKPLPQNLSFGRLLCFEGGFGSAGTKPPAVIGAVFRCLIPVLNNKEGSVIMPLLSSGDQGYSKKLVLRQVMTAAVNWMRAGLPLRNLKIVIFARDPEKEDASNTPLFELFQEFKDKYEDKNIDEEKPEDAVDVKDVYLSHCKEDHNTAKEVRTFLESKGDISIFDEEQELNEEESWQEEIYNAMVRCSRVITLLSPGYLSSVSCIEQYNMALCISRRTHKEVLAPLYITSVPTLPTYMGLMQYIDCRPRDKDKLDQATGSIKDWLENNKQTPHTSSTVSMQPSSRDEHDVFISYSHCNNSQAMGLLQLIKDHNPDVNVFIDTSGLNTGASWQQSLYHALDNSKSMIALLSPDYVKSKVCKEEFSIALALHLDPARDFRLVTMVVEPVPELPVWCRKPMPIDCASEDVDVTQRMSTLARSVVRALKNEQDANDDLESRLANLKNDHISIDEFTQKYRQIQFVHRNKLLNEPVPFNAAKSERSGHAHDVAFAVESHHKSAVSMEKEVTEQTDQSKCDVALSYAVEDLAAAATLKQLLLERYPSLKLSEPQANAASRLASLDAARFIVLLLSPAFLNSKELVHELNIALYRNRYTKEQIFNTVQIAHLPLHPTYVHLIPCDFAANDYPWKVRAGLVPEARIEHLARENDIGEGVASCLIDASDTIAARLSDHVNAADDHCQVLLNAHEVMDTWGELRKSLENEQGLVAVKRAFGFGIYTITAMPESEKIIEKDDKPESGNDKDGNKDGNIETAKKNEVGVQEQEENDPSDEKPPDKTNDQSLGEEGSRDDKSGGEPVPSRTRTVSFSPDVEVAEHYESPDEGKDAMGRSSTCLLI